MGFAEYGDSILRNNRRLQRVKGKLFWKKQEVKIDYSARDGVSHQYQEVLDRENKRYLRKRLNPDVVQGVLKRMAILLVVGILLFGLYQLQILFRL